MGRPLPGSRSRYVFALPQERGLVYLGITDEPVTGPVPDEDPVPGAAEVDQLLATVNRVLGVPLTAEELEGIAGLEEELTVEDIRQMPVEEIVRRLQSFEDAQSRKIESYRARNTTHLRFQGGTGAQSVETTLAGAYFFRRGEGFECGAVANADLPARGADGPGARQLVEPARNHLAGGAGHSRHLLLRELRVGIGAVLAVL